MSGELLDLLGDRVDPGHGQQGRPQHLVTDEKRCKVMLLLAVKKTLDQVAAALGITQKTLRKHYSREVRVRDAALHVVEGELLASLAKEAAAGNVSAIDKLLKRIDRAELAAIGGQLPKPKKKEPVLGKKETALREAKYAHRETDWGELLN